MSNEKLGAEQGREFPWAAETMRLIDVLTPETKGKAFDPDWFLLRQRLEEFERRAATQRAPVEQRPKAVLITDDGHPRLILKCPQCGYNTPKYLNVQGLGCSECNPSRNVLAAAPDHAREGALRFATYKDWIASLPKCVGDDGGCDGDLVGLAHEQHCPMFGKEFATTKDVFEAGREALADGKEGPL